MIYLFKCYYLMFTILKFSYTFKKSLECPNVRCIVSKEQTIELILHKFSSFTPLIFKFYFLFLSLLKTIQKNIKLFELF